MTDTLLRDPIAEKAVLFTSSPVVSISRISDGSINDTYEVTTEDGVFILQKMSPIFDPSVMDNLEMVQEELKVAGVRIPEGMRTVHGDGYVVNGGGAWYRALSYIPGRTIHSHISSAGAKSAGRLAGAFHSALSDHSYTLHEAIKHFHDTPYYFSRMARIAEEYNDTEKESTLTPIVENIQKRYALLDVQATDLPTRIIHADLKISNIRFSAEGDEAIALIDMDTLMHGSVIVEMGDALRSWCGTNGEDDPVQVFDFDIAQAALLGYKETASAITEEEINAIPDGIALLTLELAARFVTDAYEEKYFAQSSHYPNLYEQNKTKAENQLKLLDAFEEGRSVLDI